MAAKIFPGAPISNLLASISPNPGSLDPLFEMIRILGIAPLNAADKILPSSQLKYPMS